MGMKRKLNQKSLYQEGGAMSSTNSANNTSSLAQDIQSQMQLGVSPSIIYRDMLVSYLPADEINAAFQELGYSQDDVSDLYEQVVEMMNEQQQSSESTMQEAQFGGWVNAPNYYLPMDLGRKGDPLNAALFAGKAITDLFGGKDRDGDGFKDGAWRDLGKKRKAFKNFKNQKLQSFIPDSTSDTINSDSYDPELEVANYLKQARDEERSRLSISEPDFPVTSSTTSATTPKQTPKQTPVDYSYLDPAISQMLDFESKSGGYDASMGAYGLTNLGANRYMMGPNSLNINSPTYRADLTERIKQDYAPSLAGFAQEAQPAMLDYAYNTGRDPRIYMLDAYLKEQGQPGGLSNRGAYKDAMQDYTWTDKNLEQQFNTEYDKYKDAIGNLSGQDQLRLMNEGRKFYYNNINQVNGQPNPAAQATWLQRPFYKSGGGLPKAQKGIPTTADNGADRPTYVIENWEDFFETEKKVPFSNDSGALPTIQMSGYTEPTYGKYWGRNWKSKSGQMAPSGGGYYYMSPNDEVLTPDEYKMMTKPLRKNLVFQNGGQLPTDKYGNPIRARIIEGDGGRTHYDPRTNTIVLNNDYDAMTPEEKKNVIAHENFHGFQFRNGMSTYLGDGAPIVRPPMMSTDEHYFKYHNRKPTEAGMDVDNFIEANPDFGFVPWDLIFDKEIDLKGVQYNNPHSMEGQATYYENTGQIFPFKDGGQLPKAQEGRENIPTYITPEMTVEAFPDATPAQKAALSTGPGNPIYRNTKLELMKNKDPWFPIPDNELRNVASFITFHDNIDGVNQANLNKAYNFATQWMSSPRYKEMLNKSGGTGWWTNSHDVAQARINNFNKIQSAPLYIKDDPDHNFTEEELSGIGGYSRSDNGLIFVNPDSGAYNTTLYDHEMSHSIDRPKNIISFALAQLGGTEGRLIPDSDVNLITSLVDDSIPQDRTVTFWNQYGDTPEEGTRNYFSDPTEVRARLNEIRRLLNGKGVDVFNNKITPDDFNKVLIHKPAKDLRKIYSDENILKLLNTISYVNDNVDTMSYAKLGGQLPKYQIQGEVLPEVTVTPFDNVMPNMPQTFDTIAPDFSGFEDINKNNIPDYLERNDPAKNQMGTQEVQGETKTTSVQGPQLPPDPFDNVIPDMSNTFDNVQGDVSTDTTGEDLPMYNRNPFVEAFGKTSNVLVSGANLANEIFQNKRARQAEQDFIYSTMADKIYGAYNERPGSRGMWDVNTGLAQPDNLDVGYAQMGMEMSPKLNMLKMFTGGGMVYNDMYMPQYQVGGEAQVDNQTLAALIAAGADIEIL